MSLVPTARCTAETSQTGCWFSNSSTAGCAGSVEPLARDAGVKRSQGATLRHHGAERVSAAQSDVVEVADDDAVGLPQRRLGVRHSFRRAVGGDEGLHLAEDGRAIEGNRWCSI